MSIMTTIQALKHLQVEAIGHVNETACGDTEIHDRLERIEAALDVLDKALNHEARLELAKRDAHLRVLEVNLEGADFFCSLEILYHEGYGYQYALDVLGSDPCYYSMYYDTRAKAWTAGVNAIQGLTLPLLDQLPTKIRRD